MTAPVVDVRDRKTWAGLAWIIVGLLTCLGALYLFGGIKVTATDRVYEVVRVIPGGMRAHGGIMLVLAVAVAAGLTPPIARKPFRHSYTRGALVIVLAYELWVIFAFGAAWRINGTNASIPMVWWIAGCAISVLLIVRSPRPAPSTRRRPCSPRHHH